MYFLKQTNFVIGLKHNFISILCAQIDTAFRLLNPSWPSSRNLLKSNTAANSFRFGKNSQRKPFMRIECKLRVSRIGDVSLAGRPCITWGRRWAAPAAVRCARCASRARRSAPSSDLLLQRLAMRIKKAVTMSRCRYADNVISTKYFRRHFTRKILYEIDFDVRRAQLELKRLLLLHRCRVFG